MLAKYVMVSLACYAILMQDVSGRSSRKEKEKKKSHRGGTAAVGVAGVAAGAGVGGGGGGSGSSSSSSAAINLCDIQEQGMNVYCYCNAQDIDNATESTCWIFNGEKPEEDGVWDYFVSQPNLERLKFNIRPDGRLSFVPTRALRYLVRLSMFDIQYASIHDIPAYAFANLSSIRDLSVTRSQVIRLWPLAFAHLPRVDVINLGENRIAEVSRDVFVTPSLRRLYLDRNNVSVLHDGAFRHLTQLQELELNGNQLTVVTRETFAGLSRLRRLDLHMNHLSMLGDLTFAELSALDEMLLAENDLQYVSDAAFHGLTSLTKLTLAENRIKLLASDVFAALPGIQLLDLRDNHLATLTADTVRPLLENLKNASTVFYLEGNSFTCDCRLSWMYALRNETPNEQVRNNLEELTCILKEPLDYGNLQDDDTLPTTDSVRDFVGDAPGRDTNPDKPDASYEEEDEDDDDDDDDDEEDDEELASTDTATSMPDNTRHLFQIPANLLPCPEDLQDLHDTTEQPFLTSVYGYGREMSANTGSGSHVVASTHAAILLVGVCIVVLVT